MKVNEWAGAGNHTTALYWEYDTRIGRRFNLDPKPIIGLSEYCTFNNSPIWLKDIHGDVVVVDDLLIGFAKGLFTKKENFEEGANSRLENAFKRGGRQAVNSAKIYGGLFTTDKEKSLAGKVWQLTSRFTWEAAQTLVGLTSAQLNNTVFNVSSVTYKHGATHVESKNYWKKNTISGFTLGSFIQTSKGGDKLFNHEYGHYIQSQIWGPLYLPVIAGPSFVNGVFDTPGGAQ
jgi:hypothetical protein